jgi:hypothetical protein
MNKNTVLWHISSAMIHLEAVQQNFIPTHESFEAMEWTWINLRVAQWVIQEGETPNGLDLKAFYQCHLRLTAALGLHVSRWEALKGGLESYLRGASGRDFSTPGIPPVTPLPCPAKNAPLPTDHSTTASACHQAPSTPQSVDSRVDNAPAPVSLTLQVSCGQAKRILEIIQVK